MAGSVPIIAPRSLTEVKGLQARPVFFLKFNNAPNYSLVVKGESKDQAAALNDADREISILWSSKMMKNVNNNLVNTKMLVDPELDRFLRFARATYAAGTPQHQFLGGNYMWVKMPFVAGITEAELFDEGAGAFTIVRMKAVLKEFLRPQVWRDLGKIVAVDIFNGNNDRFLLDKQPGGLLTVQWANQGNMMFLPTGAPTTMIGLDAFDPSGAIDGRSNLAGGAGMGVLLDYIKIGGQWEPLKRDLAEKCTDAIGHELNRRMSGQQVAIMINGPQGGHVLRVRKDEVKQTLRPFSTYFKEGLDQGILQLRQYLIGKRAQYAAMQAANPKNVPQGIINRINYLGW